MYLSEELLNLFNRTVLVICILGILFLLRGNFYFINQYYRQFGVPQPLEPPLIGYGGMMFFIRPQINDFVTKIYRFATGAKYVGFHNFTAPTVAICDPDLVEEVLVTHSDHFTDYHQIAIDDLHCPVLSHNPTFAEFPSWRKMQNQLRSILTQENMRNMYGPMSQCAEDFTEEFLRLYSEQVGAIDMKDVFSRYASDATAALVGIEVNSLRNRENPFYAIGKRFTDATRGWKIWKFKVLQFVFMARLIRLLFLKLFMMRIKNMDFYVNQMLEMNGRRRPNVIRLLMNANVDNDIRSMASRALRCFLSRLETISVQMCLVAHELATHPEVQQELQEEIATTLRQYNGELTYTVVDNMEYLNAVLNETFRIHPGTGMLTRLCIQNYDLPAAIQGTTPICIEPGMNVIIPIAAINKDPRIYDDPDIFRPERFLGEGHRRAANSGPMNLNFELGPSVCLGNKFAVMIMKVMFVNLLAKCTLMPCAKTWSLVYDTRSFSSGAKGGFFLRIRN